MLLALAFGGLVALSVGAVLALSVRANFINTRSLLGSGAVTLIQAMEREIDAQSGPAARVVQSLGRLYVDGEIGKEDSPERRIAVRALIDSAPGVQGIVLRFAEGEDSAYFRDQGFSPVSAELAALTRTPTLAEEIEGGSGSSPPPEPRWQEPASIGGKLFHVVVAPMGNDGFAYAFVEQDMVNRVMQSLATTDGATVFLLTKDGHVLAHSGQPMQFGSGEFLSISEFPDAALRGFPLAVEGQAFSQANEQGISLRSSPDIFSGYVYISKTLIGYSAQPLTLGVYFLKVDIGAELIRVVYVLLAGIVGLILAVIAAIYLGRKISRPMEQVAESASKLSELHLEDIKPLPRSRIREIDRQTTALNNMYTTVQQFTRYVPRELVERLMRSGETADKPVEREVSVLFTDIAGFTNLSEKMNAGEIARLLNRHFELLTRNISETGGTVDKFMGDGAMAFWGAPANDPDHVQHALTAVKNIVRDLETENAEKRSRGEPILRLRLGLHTGPVVVGNIGGAARQNYTIVGDTVNVAQRLEQLAKEYMQEDRQAVALVSSAVSDAAGSDFSFTPAIKHKIRGREGSVGVCLLDTG